MVRTLTAQIWEMSLNILDNSLCQGIIRTGCLRCLIFRKIGQNFSNVKRIGHQGATYNVYCITYVDYIKRFKISAFRNFTPNYINDKAHIPSIHAVNSDTHTLRIQYEYTQTQCVGVANEGIDIRYMGVRNY